MDSKMFWNQFINTGCIQSYIDYKNALYNEQSEVSTIADSNRGTCDSGNEYWGSGPFNNTVN